MNLLDEGIDRYLGIGWKSRRLVPRRDLFRSDAQGFVRSLNAINIILANKMSEPKYNWNRYWTLRDGSGIPLDGNGFLIRGEFFKGSVEFASIAEVPCLILLGEPGIGKSHAVNDAVRHVCECLTADQCVSLDLRSFGDEGRLHNELFKSARIQEWKNGGYRLHLFLDSFDECLLRVDTLAPLIANELKSGEYPIDRLCLRIASRTAEFPRSLENALQEIWKAKENVKVYELCPLQASDVAEAATINDLSSQDFFAEIVAKNAGTLAARPITLRFLLNVYRKTNQLPDKLTELYEEGCRILCDEHNEGRRNLSRIRSSLTADQKLVVAARTAAVMVFCNKVAVWKEPDTGEREEADVLLHEISGYEEVSHNAAFQVTEDGIRETLFNTGLFSGRPGHRMGWAHQTFAEFLAAWYVARHNLSTEQLRSLITRPSDSESQVTPQLQETAAWLVSLRLDLCKDLLKTDPLVLLRSDAASFSADFRAKLVDELLRIFSQEKASDWGLNYQRLKHPDLASQLLAVIKDKTANYLARRFAIDVVESCQVLELQNDLADVILDETEPDFVRANAGYALWRVGDAETRRRIKQLAIQGTKNDKDERVRGVALLCNWNDNMSAEEAFASLVHSPNLHVSYSLFLGHFTEKLRAEDLPTGLRWIKNNASNYEGDYAVGRVIDEIMLLAWQNLDVETSEITRLFAEASLARLRGFQNDIIDLSQNDQAERFSQELADSHKRRAVLKAILPLVDNQNPDLFLISDSRILHPRKQDLPWLLEELNKAKTEEEERLWLQLLASFYSGWAVEVEAFGILYEAYQNNDAVRKYYSWVFNAVELDTPEADQQRNAHERLIAPRKEREQRLKKEVLTPSPIERVLSSLHKFENGDVDSWWGLNWELGLRPYGNKQYIDELQVDLRKLPGWDEAEELTRKRIIEAAKRYVLEGEPQNVEWVGTNIMFRPAFSGYRALYLLLAESPELIEDLSEDIWAKWAAVIVSYPLNSYGGDEMIPHQHLVERAYRSAPQNVIATISIQIDAATDKDESYYFPQRLDVCWDERFKEALRNRLTDETLNFRNWGRILEELLERKDSPTERIARTILGRFAEENIERERALLAVASLIRHAESYDWWSAVWSAINNDTDFGRRLVQSVCHQTRPANKLEESAAADFYLWLVNVFPLAEDPETPMGHAFAVSTRMEITDWRDSFLNDLKQRGTPESLAALERIAASSPELAKRLHWILIEARQNVRRHTWKPLTPSALLALLKMNSKTKTTPLFLSGLRQWLIEHPGWAFVGAATIMAGLGEYAIGVALLPMAFLAFAVRVYDWLGLSERKWARRIVKMIWLLGVVVLLGFFGTVFYRMKGSKSWSTVLPTAQQSVLPKASDVPKKVPFFLTTLDGTLPVSSVFGGTYSVFEDRVEVTIDSASFKNNTLDNQPIVIGFISGGLAIRNDVGHWRIIHRAEIAKAEVTVNPSSSKGFFPAEIHMRIPYPPNTDLKPFHLVLAPMIQTNENRWVSEPEWCAHSDQGIFKDASLLR